MIPLLPRLSSEGLRIPSFFMWKFNVCSHERRIESEEMYLSKLKAVKKGLMQDLLTGRLRVPKAMLEKTRNSK